MMTPHEIEETVEFLLQHQAAAEVRQEKTDAQIAKLVAQNRALSREMDLRDRRLSEKIERVSAKIERLSDGLQSLRDAVRDLLDHAKWTDARLRRLEQPEG